MIRREEVMANAVENNFNAINLKNTLLICGSNHVDRLKERLENMDYEVEVLSKVTPKIEQMAELRKETPLEQRPVLPRPPEEPPRQLEERPVLPRPPEEPPRSSIGYFFKVLENQLKGEPNLEQLKESLYNELLQNCSGDEQMKAVISTAVDRMNINDFRNLNLEMSVKSKPIYVNDKQVSDGKKLNIHDLVSWLKRHRKMD